MFLLAQALDNRGPDLCVNDGQPLDASDPAAQRPSADVSRTMRTGVQTKMGRTTFHATADHVVIKAATAEHDVGGRRSPVLLLVARSDLADIGALQAAAASAAAAIGRHLDPALGTDLEAWIASGKARGSRRLPRAFAALRAWLRRLLRRLQTARSSP